MYSLYLMYSPFVVLLPDFVVDQVPVYGGALRLSRHLPHDGVHPLGPPARQAVNQVAVLTPLPLLIQ